MYIRELPFSGLYIARYIAISRIVRFFCNNWITWDDKEIEKSK